MTDYIKREDVYDQLDRWARDLNNPQVYQRDDARCVIDGIPSADAVPVRHGRWIVGDSLPMHDIAGNLSWGNWYTCNQCEFKTYAIEHHITQYNYCPNCGAKMDGDADD